MEGCYVEHAALQGAVATCCTRGTVLDIVGKQEREGGKKDLCPIVYGYVLSSLVQRIYEMKNSRPDITRRNHHGSSVGRATPRLVEGAGSFPVRD